MDNEDRASVKDCVKVREIGFGEGDAHDRVHEMRTSSLATCAEEERRATFATFDAILLGRGDE